MAIKQYIYTGNILDELKKQKIQEEKERARAIKYILNDNYATLNLLKERLWDTEEQKRKAINKVLRYPQQAYYMLTEPECFELMNQDEIQTAILVSIEDPSYAYKTIVNVKYISEEQRKEALDVITLQQDSTLDILTDINIRKEDRLYVMQQVIDDICIADKYIKIIAEKKYKENEIFNDEVRKMFFNKIFTERSKDSLFRSARNNYLYDNELEQIYNKYHNDYYEQFKLTFYDYFEFCAIFNKWLEKSYRERMAKKLMTKTYWCQAHKVCRAVSFPQDIMDKLEAYKMAEKFKKLNK